MHETGMLVFPRDTLSLTEKGAVILGVSKDSVSSHKRFEEKYGLAFTLLADPERKVIEAYDVWKEKKIMAKSLWVW